MNSNIRNLTNEAAVKVLSLVAKKWLMERGLEANIVLEKTRDLSEDYNTAVNWPSFEPTPDRKTGEFARFILLTISDSTDNEVNHWVAAAISEVEKSRAHVLDPLSLIIGGGILICAILAARVKKIGSIEFYEGIPSELTNVLKAASSIKF